MSLIPSNPNNSCPVCQDARGKCRQSKEDSGYWQCMTYADARKGEVHSGYKCLGHTKDARWGQFRIDNSQEWSDQQRLEWQRENDRRQQEKAKETEDRKKRSLSATERHEQYSRLLDELNLHPDDKADLIRRGFTEEQIELCGFKSVERYQKLQGEYSELLPGVNNDNKIIATDSGYLCPVRNADGLIVAFQLRLRELREGDSNRYRWLSGGGQTLHLYPGNSSQSELPLAIHRPKGEITSIALVEGTGAKPFLTSQRLNAFTIGAAGGNFVSSPELLRQALEKASGESGGLKDVDIFPDAGDVENATVMARWKRLISLLQEWGFKVEIGWWGQSAKDGKDIDELDNFDSLTYLEAEEFLGIKPKKQKKVVNRNTTAWRNWVESSKFTPTVKLNQRYFDFPHNIPLSNAILAGKDGLGGGKTSALIRLIKRLGMGSRLIGYRNTLLHQTISRFQQDAGIGYYHLRDDDSFLMLKDCHSHVAFCLDSITHSQAHWFQDTVVILDETVSVLMHGLAAGTIGSRQSECLALLREALRECELVVCLDGNLRDIDIDLIEKLSGKDVVKIQNTFEREPHKITFVAGVDAEGELKKGDRSPLVKSLLSTHCTPWISCDSKDRGLAYAEMLSEVGKQGFVLCSETKNEPWAKEFLRDPTAFISRYKPGFMIISPSGESGLDCHGHGHFTHKFSFFSGVLSTNAQTQMMFRLRDNIPHYVFCSETGMVPDRNTPKTYSAKQFEQASNDFALQSAELVSQISGKSFVQGILDAVLEKTDYDYWQYSCSLGALDNFEIDNLRECLIYALQESGHKVEELEWKICPKTGGWEKSAFDTIQLREAKEIFAAKDIPFDEAQKLKRKDGTKEINRQVQKAFFLNRLPEINQCDEWNKDVVVDDEGFPTFVECSEENDHLKGGEWWLYLNKTNRNYISALERFWQLRHFEIAHKRHEKRWFDFANKDELNKVEARKRGTTFNTIWALNELKLLSYLDGEWCAESPEIIALEERGHSLEISLALGFSPGKIRKGNPQRIEYLNKLLALIGCRLDTPVQRGTKQRQRFYKVLKRLKESNLFIKKYQEKKVPIPQSLWFDDWECPLRIALCKAIDRKFTNWAAENADELQWNPESPLENQGQEVVADESDTINEPETKLDWLIQAFADCKDISDFKFAIDGESENDIEDALLYQEAGHRQQLSCWWNELKAEQDAPQQVEFPPLSSYSEGDEVWGFFPQSEQGWMKGVVKKVCQNLVRVTSGFMGIHIEKANLIAPGDWILA